jgi:hypothetical protein
MHDEWYRRPGAERCERGAGCSIVRSIDDAGVRPGLATGSARARAPRAPAAGFMSSSATSIHTRTLFLHFDGRWPKRLAPQLLWNARMNDKITLTKS